MSSDVSILLNARDLFSTVQPCIENLLRHVGPDVPISAVIGGAPEALRRRWLAAFSGRVSFRFEERFLNQAEARNLGLSKIQTPLVVCMDCDVFVRPGWLDALLACQRDTGASMVVPVILERPRFIHCAGCDLYVTHQDGKPYGHKVLRFWRFPYGESSNLERRPTDYGELHCQLLELEPVRRLGAFDEQIREVGEVDCGLTLRKEGKPFYLEPGSVVHFVEDAPIRAEDVRFFTWRWDMHAILEGYRHFERKWGLDISEHGGFRDFLYRRNMRVGLLPRLLPSEAALAASDALWRWGWRLRRLLALPDDLLARARQRRLGYDAWPQLEAARENERLLGHPALERPRRIRG